MLLLSVVMDPTQTLGWLLFVTDLENQTSNLKSQNFLNDEHQENEYYNS